MSLGDQFARNAQPPDIGRAGTRDLGAKYGAFIVDRRQRDTAVLLFCALADLAIPIHIGQYALLTSGWGATACLTSKEGHSGY